MDAGLRSHGTPLAGQAPVAVPPAAMARWRGRRPLKRWRYVMLADERLMLCAAHVSVGPARQSFWAVWDRERRVLHERTHRARHGALSLSRERLALRDAGVELALELHEDPDAAVETLTAHGGEYVWTRKQGELSARGRVRLPGAAPVALSARGLSDETAGYHARETEWWWAAGVGESRDGRRLAFNLVRGVGDPAAGSERSLWVDGDPRELGPVDFAADLSTVGGLRFDVEAVRARRENLVLVRSDYRAPFGRFTGELDGVAVAHALGVMEHHRARW